MSFQLKDTMVACPNCGFSMDFEDLGFEDGEEIWEDGFGDDNEQEGIAICPNCGTHFRLTVEREWMPYYSVQEGEILEDEENGLLEANK